MRKSILAAIILTLLLFPISLISGCGGEEKAPAPKESAKIGVITHLNASETEYNELMKKSMLKHDLNMAIRTMVKQREGV